MLMILLTVMCLAIGIKALLSWEIPISKTRIWRGRATLAVSIPLTLFGVLLALVQLIALLRTL